MGTYKCNGAGASCTVTVDSAKGVMTAITDGWIFTPDAGATSDVADADYLHYGFWLMRTTKDGATTYNEVETFAEATGFDGPPLPVADSDRESHRYCDCIKVARLVCM